MKNIFNPIRLINSKVNPQHIYGRHARCAVMRKRKKALSRGVIELGLEHDSFLRGFGWDLDYSWRVYWFWKYFYTNKFSDSSVLSETLILNFWRLPCTKRVGWYQPVFIILAIQRDLLNRYPIGHCALQNSLSASLALNSKGSKYWSLNGILRHKSRGLS